MLHCNLRFKFIPYSNVFKCLIKYNLCMSDSLCLSPTILHNIMSCRNGCSFLVRLEWLLLCVTDYHKHTHSFCPPTRSHESRQLDHNEGYFGGGSAPEGRTDGRALYWITALVQVSTMALVPSHPKQTTHMHGYVLPITIIKRHGTLF